MTIGALAATGVGSWPLGLLLGTFGAVKFDWLDESTYKNPFEHKFPNGETIKAIYVVSPETKEAAPTVNAYIDYCIKEHGVQRFVLLAGSSAEPGGWHIGKVWQHVLDIGVDYAVLRPSWFMGMWQFQKTRKFYQCD